MTEYEKKDIQRQICDICTKHNIMQVYAHDNLVDFVNKTFDNMLKQYDVVYSVLIDFQNGTELFLTDDDKIMLTKNIVPVLKEEYVVDIVKRNFNTVINTKPKEWIFVQNRGDEYLFFTPTITDEIINQFKNQLSKQGIECYIVIVKYTEKPKKFFRIEYEMLKKLKQAINPKSQE